MTIRDVTIRTHPDWEMWATPMSDLYNALGGEQSIAAVVDELYVRLVADTTLGHHFHPARLDSLKAGQREWFTAALSNSPDLPTNLADAHAHLPITDEQVGRVIGHLDDVLRDLGVTSYLRRSVVAVAARLWYARSF